MMPIKATRFDYVLLILLIIIFMLSFFTWSRWGDLHYCSNPDPAKESDINMAVYITPLFAIYFLFNILVLDGKPRIREMNKGFLLLRLRILIHKKITEGLYDYRKWRNK